MQRCNDTTTIWLLLLLFLGNVVVLSLILMHPPAWSLDVGSTPDARTHTWFTTDSHFITHFSVPETTETANGLRAFRWSEQDSQMMLHGADVPVVLGLHLYGDERTHDFATWLVNIQRVQKTHHNKPIATVAIRPAWRVYSFILPVQPQLTTQPLTLESTIYRHSANDHRTLGIPVDTIEITPLQQQALTVNVVVRVFILTWLVAVVAGVMWLLDALVVSRSRWARRRRARALALLLPPFTVAYVLWWWAAHNPYTLAWALPPLPWLLGITSLIVVHIILEQRVFHRTVQHIHQTIPLIAIGLLITAQTLFTLHSSVSIGIALAVIGMLLLARTPDTPEQNGVNTQQARIGMPLWVWLLGVFVLALATRFYRIDELPYGLWRDEANHGLIALRILEDPTYRPVYVANAYVNMPALGFYPFALALKLWGIQIWTMRPMTALGGALTPIVLYGLVRFLGGIRIVALLAAALLAVSSWHVALSRFSFPTIFDPLLTISGLWLFGTGITHFVTSHTPHTLWQQQYRAILKLALAGVCLGVAVQNYHTGRVVPVIAIWFAALLVLQTPHRWQQWKRWLIGGSIVAGAFLLTLTPLIYYATTHPAAFNNRVSSVFLLSDEALHGQAPLAALDESVGNHAMMFTLHGDSNGRHHAPNAPLLDMVSGLGFLAGCAVLLRRWRSTQTLFLTAALLMSILPSLLAVEGPHAMRGLGAAAFAYIIAAVGWHAIIHTLFIVNKSRAKHLSSVIAIHGLVVALATIFNSWTYFVVMPQTPDVWLASYPIHTHIGNYVRQVANTDSKTATDHLYVEQTLAKNRVFQYLTHNLTVQTYQGTHVSQPLPPDARFVFSGYMQPDEIAAVLATLGIKATPVSYGIPLPLPNTEPIKPSFVVYQRIPSTIEIH